MKKSKGFTLIEILIVIVILAVLATIVLPKMLQQPEGALVAEANHMLGALARAQDTYMQMMGATTGLTPLDWSVLGLQQPAAGGNFTYTCPTNTTCVATRGGTTPGTITLNYTTGSYTCAGNYKGGGTRGCVRV